jgi:hypothetical protein
MFHGCDLPLRMFMVVAGTNASPSMFRCGPDLVAGKDDAADPSGRERSDDFL